MPGGSTNRAITIKATFLGGKQIANETDRGAKGLHGMGKAAEESGKRARRGAAGWFTLSKQHEKTQRAAVGISAGLGGFAKKALAYSGAITGIYGVKSIVTGTQELTHSTMKFQAMSGMSSAAAMKYTEAFKALGLGADAGSTAYMYLGKAAQTAEKQEKKFAESTRTGAVALEKKRMALAKAEDSGDAYAIQAAKMSLASASQNKEMGAQAKAFNDLGINVREWQKLKPEDQFKMIIDQLSKMPPSMKRTTDISRLLGRGAGQLAFAFNKGSFSIGGLAKKAEELMPKMSGVKGGVEKVRQAGAEASIGWDALRMSIGIRLLPIISKVMMGFVNLSESIRKGHGIWGTLEHVIGGVVNVLKGVVKWFTESKFHMELLTTAVLTLGTILAAKEIVKGIEMISHAFMLLASNPLLVLAFVAVFAAIMIIKHWKQVKAFFAGLWGSIKHAAMDAWNWIKSNWPYLAAALAGPFAVAGVWAIKHWSKVLKWFEGLPRKFAHLAGAIGKGLWEGIKWGLNQVLGLWEKLIHAIGTPSFHIGPLKVPGVHPLGFVHLPRLAEGGFVRRGGPALIGERGPEVMNLPTGARVSPLGNKGGLMGAFRAEASGDLHVHVELDKREIGVAVMREFRRLAARA